MSWLSYMYQEGFLLYHQDPNLFRYDKESDMLYALETLLKWLLILTALRYLVDLTSFDTIKPEEGRHITEDSVYVHTYNIWLEDSSTQDVAAYDLRGD